MSPAGHLLAVVNFPANTGYAWDFIEGLYARIADQLGAEGVTTWVAYPALPEAPRPLAGSAARPVCLDASLETLTGAVRLLRFIRRERVGAVYFTDRPAWSPWYPLLRLAGARSVIVHDHTSGERMAPRGIKRRLKRALVRLPGFAADTVVAVSDYVARRQVEVGLIPPARVVRVWNGLALPDPGSVDRALLSRELGLDPSRPVLFTACRAAPQKGVAHLLRAFDRVVREWDGPGRPLLVYVGDGPEGPALRELRSTLGAREDIVLAGYRTDAARLAAGATIALVPSVWQDAFPLAVMEAMALGLPVIGTRVGGVPEMIEDGVTGVLVPPGDESALAAAMIRLLQAPAERARLARAARQRVLERFAPATQVMALVGLVRAGLRLPRGTRSASDRPPAAG